MGSIRGVCARLERWEKTSKSGARGKKQEVCGAGRHSVKKGGGKKRISKGGANEVGEPTGNKRRKNKPLVKKGSEDTRKKKTKGGEGGWVPARATLQVLIWRGRETGK